MIQNSRNDDMPVFKIIVVGQSGVGKSNIISRYITDQYRDANNVTIGVQFMSKIIQKNDKKYNLQIWDTAGQQRFRSVNKVFYKNALGVLIVFSLNDIQSFLNVERWLKQIRDQILENAVLILVGNKSDIKQRQVSVSEASRLAKQQNMAYIQTSAALNININKSFQMLTQAVLISFQGTSPKRKNKESILLKNTVIDKKQQKKKKCCKS